MSKRLNVALDDDLHRQIKIAVAEQGTTVAGFVISALKEKLEELKNQKNTERTA